MDKTKVHITKRGDDSGNILFWAEISPVQRLEILEQIRSEYNQWK